MYEKRVVQRLKMSCFVLHKEKKMGLEWHEEGKNGDRVVFWLNDPFETATLIWPNGVVSPGYILPWKLTESPQLFLQSSNKAAVSNTST